MEDTDALHDDQEFPRTDEQVHDEPDDELAAGDPATDDLAAGDPATDDLAAGEPATDDLAADELAEGELPRRAFLGAASAAAAAAVAGCTAEPDDENADAADEDGGTDDENPDESDENADEGDGTDEDADEGDDEEFAGAPDDASVSFDVPEDGAELSSTAVQWDATADGVDVVEAGTDDEGTGHYHVLIDTDPVAAGETIPSDDQHVHFGSGQEDGVVELEPGEYTLHLQLGDGEHRATDLVDTVEVTVTDDAALDVETDVDGSVVEWEASVEDYELVDAGEGVTSNAGHLHALIDEEPVPVGDEIPSDDAHVHFGDGSSSGELDLEEQLGDDYEAGEYDLTFQIGTGGSHRATSLTDEATVETE